VTSERLDRGDKVPGGNFSYRVVYSGQRSDRM
jgi:hypothetical protein